MVSTRSSNKNPASARDINTLESAASQEKVPALELHSDSEEDSDDEAPEAISTSTSKSAALHSEQAERQAKLKLAAEEKEKRRQKDQRLKEQKESSKKAAKKDKKKQNDTNEEDDKEELNKIKTDEETPMESNESKQMPKLLPPELLEQFSKEEKAEKKRIHISAKDFERMAEEEEQKQKKQKNKKRNLIEGKQVGEYTVKVLSKRPKPQPIDQGLIDFRNQHFARAQVPRRDAVLNASQGRKGGATTFARSSNVSKNKLKQH